MSGKYQYRETYHGSKRVDPAIVAGELARLQADGSLTATRVVEAAAPPSTPLHSLFEWDNSVAGHEYRLIQARTIIRAVVVVSETGPARSVYVHVPDSGPKAREGKYVPIEVVTEDAAEYERALAEAQRFLDSAETRFRELRRLTEGHGGKVEAIAIATQGFAAVREALALLKAS